MSDCPRGNRLIGECPKCGLRVEVRGAGAAYVKLYGRVLAECPEFRAQIEAAKRVFSRGREFTETTL